jgi:glycerol-3-phosphate acyltransferase PlsY
MDVYEGCVKVCLGGFQFYLFLAFVFALNFVPSFFLGYILGSIPFGLILTKLLGAGDIRSIGSGNIGATNVLRTGRKDLAALTLLLDMAKGALAILLIHKLGGSFFSGDTDGASEVNLILIPCTALGALIGHCYPVWLKFKGGKGVATMLGIGFALSWSIGLISALVWVGGMLLTKISSVGGMASAVAAPLVALAIGQHEMAAVLTLMAVIVIWKHRANIARLRAGTEPKIGQKST